MFNPGNFNPVVPEGLEANTEDLSAWLDQLAHQPPQATSLQPLTAEHTADTCRSAFPSIAAMLPRISRNAAHPLPLHHPYFQPGRIPGINRVGANGVGVNQGGMNQGGMPPMLCSLREAGSLAFDAQRAPAEPPRRQSDSSLAAACHRDAQAPERLPFPSAFPADHHAATTTTTATQAETASGSHTAASEQVRDPFNDLREVISLKAALSSDLQLSSNTTLAVIILLTLAPNWPFNLRIRYSDAHAHPQVNAGLPRTQLRAGQLMALPVYIERTRDGHLMVGRHFMPSDLRTSVMNSEWAPFDAVVSGVRLFHQEESAQALRCLMAPTGIDPATVRRQVDGLGRPIGEYLRTLQALRAATVRLVDDMIRVATDRVAVSAPPAQS